MTVGLYCVWKAFMDFRRNKPRVAALGAALGAIVIAQDIAVSAVKIAYFASEGLWP
jgi:hypothetical protein